jgi:D-sedoheptulose 7-phosphate isomerase
MKDIIKNTIEKSAETILSCNNIIPEIEKSIEIIVDSIAKGNKIILFGNGGSAADAQHIAAELIGRFNIERKSYPAIALTTDSSILTSLSNDYSFDIVFSRQCESIVSKGDVSIGISTSGKSKNILKGLKISKEKGAATIALLGNNGGIIKENVDIALVIDSSSTARIQEAHRTIYHIICEEVEKKLVNIE